MTLAALLSAGAPADKVRAILQNLEVPHDLETEVVEVSGIRALRVTITHPEQHAHRTFQDVQTLIEAADLPQKVTDLALAAFRRLAEAEARVHGGSPEDITFHEVGAVDSIVDMVASCGALHLLGAETVSCGLLPMGSGVVDSAHGPLPIPGPATLEILKGSRVRWTEERRETTTPTGAALMHTFTGGEFTEAAPPITLHSIGHGAGRARLENAPNLLRAVVGEREGPTGGVVLLEANVDDASGEILGWAVESLMRAGALDAWLEPIVMKKGRGAYKVCVLAEAEDQDSLSRKLMRETGSLGVRYREMGRTVAERRVVRVDLPYGSCGIKVGSLDGKDFSAAPEHTDAARLSEQTSLPLNRVYAEALAAFESLKSNPEG